VTVNWQLEPGVMDVGQ